MLLDAMAGELALSRHYIEFIARTASHAYREYFVTGRSGRRLVHHPSRQLKALQRWLLRRVITRLPVHDAATAYEIGRGIRTNALRHIGSAFLLRMDFTGFFPSITDVDVKNALDRARTSGRIEQSWTTDDSDLFVSIVCRFDRLAIGAPSSPRLANAVCFDLDEQLLGLAKEYGVTYTRYADDLFFSATKPGVLPQVENRVGELVLRLKHPQNLKLNASKTKHSSRAGRRVVTGIILTQAGLSLGRSTKRKLRSQVHNLHRLSKPERASLSGWLAYSKSIEPDFVNRLILRFGSATVNEAMK